MTSEDMLPSCAGIILAGGRNSRMNGTNKAFLRIGGAYCLDRILDSLHCCFSEIILVTKEPENYHSRKFRIVKDILNVQSPLSGIHAGLVNMTTDFAFVIGCDTPFLKTELVKMLMEEIDPDSDVVVPFSETYFQPLCAVYSKRCIPYIESRLLQNDLKVDNLFLKVSLKKILYEKLMEVDSQLISFFNINSAEDLMAAERMLMETAAC